jgi:hypothetical protein
MGSYTINNGALSQMFRSPSGPAAQELQRRTLRVENRAKVLCPVDTGRLRSSIVRGQIRTTATGLAQSVGSPVVYAAAIHEGSGPPSWSGGRGPRPRPFLRDALVAANPTRIETR